MKLRIEKQMILIVVAAIATSGVAMAQTTVGEPTREEIQMMTQMAEAMRAHSAEDTMMADRIQVNDGGGETVIGNANRVRVEGNKQNANRRRVNEALPAASIGNKVKPVIRRRTK